MKISLNTQLAHTPNAEFSFDLNSPLMDVWYGLDQSILRRSPALVETLNPSSDSSSQISFNPTDNEPETVPLVIESPTLKTLLFIVLEDSLSELPATESPVLNPSHLIALTQSLSELPTIALNPFLDKKEMVDAQRAVVLSTLATLDDPTLSPSMAGSPLTDVERVTQASSSDDLPTNLLASTSNVQSALDQTGPVINIWYGDFWYNDDLARVKLNKPLKAWINILGDVFDPSGVSSITYSLVKDNKAKVRLNKLDKHRAIATDDFNLDIDITALDLFKDRKIQAILIEATDTLGNVSTETITIGYRSENGWSQPYEINWQPNTNEQSLDDLNPRTSDRNTSSLQNDSTPIGLTTTSSFNPEGPLIDVWYGTEQTFGQVGLPQIWANLLGNVSDPDGVASLSYSLNGGAEIPLTLGISSIETRRLVRPNNFNVDIAYSSLNPSAVDDIVTIKAIDTLGNVSTQTVTVDYESGSTWPQSYSIDWNAVSNLQDVAQVVDGRWEVENGSVRIEETGYDRLLAVGDIAWENYEVTVPLTINQIGVTNGRDGTGAGIILQWQGHTDSPVSGLQPKAGWQPLGAIGWFRNGSLQILGKNGITKVNRTFQPGIVYNFKMRVETVPSVGGLYSLKVWQQGQAEPTAWDVQRQENLTGRQSGSAVLIAHEHDVSFGNVNIVPILPPNLPPVANNDNAEVVQGNSIIINVLSNDTDSDGTLVPTSVTLVGLPTSGTAIVNADGTITYTHNGSVNATDSLTYRVADDDGALSNLATVNIALTGQPLAFESDDFNSTTLNPRWNFINPIGDGSFTLTGTGTTDAYLNLSVSAGITHDLWKNVNNVVRVMQPAANTDFEAEVKFASVPSQRFQTQGIIIEQDNNDWIRFNTQYDGSTLRVFAATTTNGSSQTRSNIAVASAAASHLRINRQSNNWILSYSSNGTNWTTATSFNYTLGVSSVGTFAGNTGSLPAFTAQVDYFFNTAAPIVPEDGSSAIASASSSRLLNDSDSVLVGTETREADSLTRFETFSSPETHPVSDIAAIAESNSSADLPLTSDFNFNQPTFSDLVATIPTPEIVI